MAAKRTGIPQSIIITGESGSGKTVATNHLTQFLSKSSTNETSQFSKMASHIEIILEAFGNCATPENDNSSRFIKTLQLLYGPNDEISDLSVAYQLLEKSRLCVDSTNAGSNFSAFYLTALHAPLADLNLKDTAFKVNSTFFQFVQFF